MAWYAMSSVCMSVYLVRTKVFDYLGWVGILAELIILGPRCEGRTDWDYPAVPADVSASRRSSDN
jgi:hypothetical protein